MAGVNDEIRAWARSNGEQVSSRGNLPGRLKERFFAEYPDKRPPGSVALLPGPDDPWDDDAGDFDVIGLAEPDSDAEPPRKPLRYEAVPDTPQAPTADSGPAHGGKDWRGKAKRDAPSSGKTPRKVSVTVRSDINAKISFALMVPGAIWKARDPLCGGTFVEQVPEVADAFTDIVCDSADLIAFFTGPGGNFMKALKVGAALMPVVQVVAAHHVYHTIEEMPADAQQPDYGTYAA